MGWRGGGEGVLKASKHSPLKNESLEVSLLCSGGSMSKGAVMWCGTRTKSNPTPN